jgi:hypothetical protein
MMVSMNAANRKRNRKSRQHRPRAAPSESRAGEAITVAWTVTVTTLVICEMLGLSAAVAGRFSQDAGGLRMIAGLAQFCALVLAVLSLALLPVVYRVRRVAPPRPLVAFAVIAASLPPIVAVWQVLS